MVLPSRRDCRLPRQPKTPGKLLKKLFKKKKKNLVLKSGAIVWISTWGQQRRSNNIPQMWGPTSGWFFNQSTKWSWEVSGRIWEQGFILPRGEVQPLFSNATNGAQCRIKKNFYNFKLSSLSFTIILPSSSHSQKKYCIRLGPF